MSVSVLFFFGVSCYGAAVCLFARPSRKDPFLLFPNTNDCADKQERDWEFARAALHGMKIPRNHTQPALAEMSPQQVVAFSGKTETLVKLLDMCARRNDKVCQKRDYFSSPLVIMFLLSEKAHRRMGTKLITCVGCFS